MRKALVLFLFGSLLLGCGKKSEPETSSAPPVTIAAERIVMVRATAKEGSIEQATWRGVLQVTNGYSKDITLKKVEFQGTLGPVSVSETTQELDFTLAAGASTEVKLESQVGWKDDAPADGLKGSMRGTLHFRGPAGNPQQVPFNLSSDVTVRGE